MVYERYIRATFVCDRCGRKEHFEAPDDDTFVYIEADKISGLQKAGWIYANDGHICPKCVVKEFAVPQKKKKRKRKRKKVKKK